jgi:hypothetical protein
LWFEEGDSPTISYDGGTWYVLTEGTDPALMIKVA